MRTLADRVADTEIEIVSKKHCRAHFPEAVRKCDPLEFDAVKVRNLNTGKVLGILHYEFPAENLVNYADKRDESGDHRWTFGSYGNAERSNAAIRSGNVSDSAWEQYKLAAEKLEAQCEALLKVGKSTKRRRRWSDEGSELDIDRVLSLDENCWVKTKRDARARVVKLGINSAVSCGNDESTFAKLAGLAAGLATVLTRLGYGVEVWDVCALNEGGVYRTAQEHLRGCKDDKWIIGATLMKASDEPVDPARIMACSIPGRFRNNTFAVLRGGLGGSSGLGMCFQLPPEAIKYAGLDALIEIAWTSDAHTQAVNIAGLLSQVQGTEVRCDDDGNFILND